MDDGNDNDKDRLNTMLMTLELELPVTTLVLDGSTSIYILKAEQILLLIVLV